jgi:hypothetical protein
MVQPHQKRMIFGYKIKSLVSSGLSIGRLLHHNFLRIGLLLASHIPIPTIRHPINYNWCFKRIIKKHNSCIQQGDVMKIKLIVFSALMLTASAWAQTYTPRYGGGYNVQNSDGTSATITPRYGGGYTTQDSNGQSSTSTPRYGGGYTTQDSNGKSSTATPRYGGGYNVQNSNGGSSTITPRYGGGYNVQDSNGTSSTCTPRYGGGVSCN